MSAVPKKNRRPQEADAGKFFNVIRKSLSWDHFTPFLERRVPTVAPWRALNLGLDLQMT